MTARHFLIIGAQRCGTTWLHDRLAAHPGVAMARPARPEPKVFLDPRAPSADDYRARFFAHADESDLLGEKSTSYLESDVAPDAVAATLGSPRVVVQLRDPVERAVSNWSFSRDHGLEPRSLVDAIRESLAGSSPWDPAASSVNPFAYLERGRYADDLARWWGRFPVHVQFLEEQVADSTRLDALLGWLGLDPGAAPGADTPPVNASSPVDEELDPGLVADLRDYFADSDAALADLLGRGLPWQTTDGGRP